MTAGRATYAIGDTISNPDATQSMVIVEVLQPDHTTSGAALYLCSYTGSDAETYQLWMREPEIMLFRDTGGNPRGTDDNITGLQPVSLDVTFADAAVAANATTTLYAGIVGGVGIVPAGWIANLHLMELQTYDDGDDVTLATAALFVDSSGGQVSGASDVSASWNVLSVVPIDAGRAIIGSAAPLAPPYVIDATAGGKFFLVKVTTNGTAGTLGVQVRVIGTKYKAV